MKTIKLSKCKITTSDALIIGFLSLLGTIGGFLVPQTSGMDCVACLMVGAGLGLVISSIFAKNKSEKQ